MNGLHCSIGVIAAWASLCTAIVYVSLASPVVKLCGTLDDIAPYILTNTKPAPKKKEEEENRQLTISGLPAKGPITYKLSTTWQHGPIGARSPVPATARQTPVGQFLALRPQGYPPGVLPMRARNDRW